MYNASNVLVKNLLFSKSKVKHKKKKIGFHKNRFYYGDSNYYRNIYLKTQHWYMLRNEKLKICWCCERCGSTKHLDVHHKHYHHLYDVSVHDLVTLCRKCHYIIHHQIS